MYQSYYTGYGEHSRDTYYPNIRLQSTGTGQLIGHSMENYHPLSIRSHPIASDYIQSKTLQVQPYYSVIKSSSLGTLKTTADIRPLNKDRLNKEIDSDDFLREFFSISKKIEHVPSPKQIKEQYYSR